MAGIKKIREAVLKNRGGLENATDAQLRRLWKCLSPETKKEYLDSLKKKGKEDAAGD